jgi:hypothetical protein
MAKFLTYQDRIQLFLDKCIPEPNSGCWLWLGAVWKHDDGRIRGECKTFGRREFATRAAYRELGGKALLPGLLLRHICDTPLCVNPDHLLPGTHEDNMADMMSRNRSAKGECQGNSKLTADDIRAIRASAGKQRDIAARFGIKQATVWRIKHRLAWPHVD